MRRYQRGGWRRESHRRKFTWVNIIFLIILFVFIIFYQSTIGEKVGGCFTMLTEQPVDVIQEKDDEKQ